MMKLISGSKSVLKLEQILVLTSLKGHFSFISTQILPKFKDPLFQSLGSQQKI